MLFLVNILILDGRILIQSGGNIMRKEISSLVLNLVLDGRLLILFETAKL